MKRSLDSTETLWGDRRGRKGLLLKNPQFQPPSRWGRLANSTPWSTPATVMLLDAWLTASTSSKNKKADVWPTPSERLRPGRYRMILLTHCHFDHLWGISDGKRTRSMLFPSAEFVAAETRGRLWSDHELTGQSVRQTARW